VPLRKRNARRNTKITRYVLQSGRHFARFFAGRKKALFRARFRLESLGFFPARIFAFIRRV
jgi:hypothetical protein